ncbi:Uncharacterised protein [Achromobacter aegrifaciens]|jgi:hypothetical protein|uniref:Uncharacterized protein n=1 Tax=Achromobacter aegrifaciens TaxID=1287736 RepID=A0AAD2J4Y2_ACHAE|nr:Uncharacterised protein [Achromobacter aegrifaciens]
MKPSLRAYHMPSLTLAWNWISPTGSRLVKIISARPRFMPQNASFIKPGLSAYCGRM